MLGGFTNYAHLRLRDHRPGNGEYELPPEFGPNSGSSKRTILARHYVPAGGESCSVGPGAYAVPTTIGSGRATRIAPLRSAAAVTSVGAGDGAPVPVAADPKQYSMALYPDTPAYSLYGRLKSEWERQSAYASPGPAAYTSPGHFDTLDPEHQRLHPVSGPTPGVHLGLRTTLPGSREQEGVPGPGAYHLVRFGDELPRSREPLVTRRRHRGGAAAETPGPGAYDDPTSIGYRSDQVRLKRFFAQSSTFGGRWRGREFHTTGPGPAAYNTLSATKRLEKNQRHAPKFARPHPALDRQSVTEAAATRARAGSPGGTAPPPFPVLPSDFDFDFKKGKTIAGRRHEPLARGAPSHSMSGAPGDSPTGERAFWESPLPSGGRFTAAPYDANAHRLAAEKAETDAARLAQGANARPGPGAYNVDHDPTAPRAPASLFGHTLSAKFASAENGVPGPGHYRLAEAASSSGTVFHKGDFHPRGGGGGGAGTESIGVGPGAHYKDDTMYSRSINGDRASNKGYTMGIRYPARATYQHCAPYDETTNINCVYDDERTWEARPSLHLPPVNRTATR
ncbi:Sperm-tail PG-rich repeat [Novymonas esmeraldas]|uniref:Sperm-tail PG-rich repeat n=1 Tax=Novymonas esmeraldas TaxID=1808958 RepID=A0AAW0EY74_9TRYP